MSNPATPAAPEVKFRWFALRWTVLFLLFYGVLAYLVVPFGWREAEGKQHPALSNLPEISRTHDNIPGDPLNIALIGPETSVSGAMMAAGWHPADPLTLRSCIRIAGDTVFHQPYEDAPVSNLFVWGRKQDLAFELPVGNDPSKRHHVRFWRSTELDQQGNPLWIGGATFDHKVGLSHRTGQITHHISADVDAERDKILSDLQKAGKVGSVDWIDGFHKELKGRNGGGDPWQTDGRLPIITLVP